VDFPARNSFFPEIVPKKHLFSAVSLNSTVFNLARTIGPMVAAAIVPFFGIAACFFINAVSFVAVVTMLMVMKIEKEAQYESARDTVEGMNVRTVLSDTWDGLKYIRSNFKLLLTLLTVLGVSLFIANFNVSLLALSNQILSAGENGYFILTTEMGVGSLAAAVTLTLNSRRKPTNAMVVIFSLSVSIFMILLGIWKSFILACVIMFFVGFFLIGQNILANTHLQMNAADDKRGRVMSAYNMVMTGTNPIGNVYTGELAEYLGIQFCIILSGVICTAASLGIMAMNLSNKKKEASHG